MAAVQGLMYPLPSTLPNYILVNMEQYPLSDVALENVMNVYAAVVNTHCILMNGLAAYVVHNPSMFALLNDLKTYNRYEEQAKRLAIQKNIVIMGRWFPVINLEQAVQEFLAEYNIFVPVKSARMLSGHCRGHRVTVVEFNSVLEKQRVLESMPDFAAFCEIRVHSDLTHIERRVLTYLKKVAGSLRMQGFEVQFEIGGLRVNGIWIPFRDFDLSFLRPIFVA